MKSMSVPEVFAVGSDDEIQRGLWSGRVKVGWGGCKLRLFDFILINHYVVINIGVRLDKVDDLE